MTLADRPEQALSGPVLGRSHLGRKRVRGRDAVSSRVPLDAGRTSALLLANSRAVACIGREPSIRVTSGEPYVSWTTAFTSPESQRQHVYATAALVVVLTSESTDASLGICPQRSRSE